MTLMAALTGHAVASLCLTKARHGPVLLLDTRGGELPFAASAKSKGQREESGRSGLRLSFFRCANAEYQWRFRGLNLRRQIYKSVSNQVAP
jgi:hypothetical protein